jgi:hypothetical protein
MTRHVPSTIARLIATLGLVLIVPEWARGDYLVTYSTVDQGNLVTDPFANPPQSYQPFGPLTASFNAPGFSSSPGFVFDMNSVLPNSAFTRADLILNVTAHQGAIGPTISTVFTYGFDTSPNFTAPTFFTTAGPSGPVGVVTLNNATPQVTTVTLDITSILLTQRSLGGRYLKFYGTVGSGQGTTIFGANLGLVPEPPTAVLATLGLTLVGAGAWWASRLEKRRRGAGAAIQNA